MSVRKNIVALGVATAAIAGTAITAMAPANAADPYPWYTKANSGVATGSTLAAGSIIGGGSDTIQFVDGALAQAYNTKNGVTAGQDAGAMVSLAACLPPGADGSTAVDTLFACPTSNADKSTPVFPFAFPADSTGKFDADAVKLATSSGSGADLLADSTNGGVDQVPGMAFARASGIKNSDYLDAYPFALDEVVMVTSGKVATNAPATLTRAEIAGIYDGNYTNWDQLGGKNAPIHAYAIGNGGSGTLQAFYDQLTAEDSATYPSRNGGSVDTSKFAIGNPANPAGSFVSTVGESGPGGKAGAAAGKTIIEHDPTAVQNDPDAIAAFSYSRVVTDGGAIKPVGGWVLDRAVFNEIRDGSRDAKNIAGVDPNWVIGGTGTADKAGGLVHDLFGPTGFFCSEDARSIMQDNGFFQLKTSCGVQQTGSSYTGTLDAYGAPTQSKTTATIAGKAITVSVASADQAVAAVPSGKVSVAFIPKNVPGAKKAVPAPVTGTLANGKVTVNAPAALAAGSYQVAVSYLGNGNAEGDFQGSWADPQGTVTVAGTTTTTKPGGTTTTTKPTPTPSVNTKLVKAEHKLTKDKKALKKTKKKAKKAHGAKKAKLQKKIKKLKKKVKADKAAVKAAK